MKDISSQKEIARLEMINMSKSFYEKQEEIMNARANQLESLHHHLEKLSQKIELDRNQIAFERQRLESDTLDRDGLQRKIDTQILEINHFKEKNTDLNTQLESATSRCNALVQETEEYANKVKLLSEAVEGAKDSNSSLQNEISNLKEQIVHSKNQRSELQRMEDELENERIDYLERLQYLEEGERRIAEYEEKETILRNDFEALVELQEKLKHEKCRIETESKQLDKSRHEILEKEAKVGAHEKKLKEYALQLQKQNIEIKEKEKTLQQAARLLSDKRHESTANDAAQIAELKRALVDEQDRYSSLYEKYQDVRSSDREIHIQERFRQIALQLKEKDEELTRSQAKLDEKLAKCDECEQKLAQWQKELETLAGMLGSNQNHN